MKGWEFIGTRAKRFAYMWGKKNSKEIIYIDNWSAGNYAVILGDEVAPSTYKEKQTIGNYRTKQEALDVLKEYMNKHGFVNSFGSGLDIQKETGAWS